MAQRKILRREYWVDAFKVEQSDLEYLSNVLLDQEVPLSVDEMALLLVRHRIHNEEQPGVSTPKPSPENQYHASRTYKVGDEMTFPSLEFATGKVVSLRAGDNEEFGKYSVIEVALEDGSKLEFASGLSADHLKVDEPIEEEEPEDETPMAPEEIFIEWGGAVIEKLEDRLKENPDLVRLAGRWFPKSLLANVNSGHLNLAEAVLDMNNGGPMTTADIIDQAGMLQSISSRLAEFSLNYGLQRDDRFDEVGAAGQVLWYLTRLEPEGVQKRPERLEYVPISSDESLLDAELVELERLIGDELSNINAPRTLHPPQSVTVSLIYPHRRAGTLPLSPQLKQMFPTAYSSPRVRFLLVDADSGKEYPAWVVRAGGYVYGLTEYFEEHDVLAGSTLTIQRTKDPNRVRISAGQRKARREWVRLTNVQNNRLRFESVQRPVGTEYDELMLIDVADPEAVDAMWKRVNERKTPLEDLMGDVMHDLISMNPQGHVHVKTLYSAINLIRRTPPGPLFARLVALPEFEQVGGQTAYWRLRAPEKKD